jgi:hypothetical protein
MPFELSHGPFIIIVHNAFSTGRSGPRLGQRTSAVASACRAEYSSLCHCAGRALSSLLAPPSSAVTCLSAPEISFKFFFIRLLVRPRAASSNFKFFLSPIRRLPTTYYLPCVSARIEEARRRAKTLEAARTTAMLANSVEAKAAVRAAKAAEAAQRPQRQQQW